MSESWQQLDLFEHSALNHLLRAFGVALASQDGLQTAEEALVQLRALPKVSAELLRDCGELLRAMTDSAIVLRDPERGLDYLRARLVPLSQRWLGANAQAYQRVLLQRLAEAMDARGFVSGRDAVHPAELWLELQQPRRAKSSVTADLFWRGCPLRLALHARISETLHELSAAVDAWARLCWTDPERGVRALAHSRVLGGAWSDFCDLNPPLDVVWFPVWLELRGELAVPRMIDPPDDAAGAAQLLLLVQKIPRAQRVSVAFRSQVRMACPSLLAHWLAAQHG